MEELRFDFGKKYAILDYKIKEIRDNTTYDASFDVDGETFAVTLTLFNEKHEAIKTASFELPLSSLITSVELDYNNKKLIFNTISSEPIECDISELINKINYIETNAIFKDEEGLVPLDNLPKTYPTDFTIKSTTDAEVEHDAFNSNALILESSVWEIQSTSEPTYVVSSSPFSSATLALQDLVFSSDGLKVFIIESTTDRIHQHSLSTAFDVTTINITATVSRALLESNPYGLTFKPDGSAFYYIGSSNKIIYQVELSTPWDLSTAGIESSSNALASGTYQSLVISSDGLKAYILNSTTDMVQVYSFGTAWTATSLNTNSVANISIVLEESTPTGLYISPDGLKAFLVGSSSDRVFEYEFNEAWGNQLTFTGNSVTTQQNVTNDLTFRPDGLAMFLIGSTTKCIDAYSIPFAFSLASDIGIAKETKEKFKIKSKATQDEVNSKLEITYNKDDASASSIIEITKEGHISKGTLPFSSLTDIPTTTFGYGITNAVIDMVHITWESLNNLRDNSLLKPGQQYRITDYECTTAQANTQSAGHPFDIIVIADSVDKLNENARACLHAGDTYFSNSKLETWKLKYCLDNDTTRFAWADDSVNGKGVIYRMIDEFNNDVPYDFKNIQFKRKLTDGELDLDSGIDTWVYTFTMSDMLNVKLVDISLKQNTEYNDDEGQYRECANNVIKEAILDYQPDGLIRIQLNDSVFLNIFDGNVSYTYYGCYSNTFGSGCSSNTFGNNCYNNTFGNYCYDNTFGNNCGANTFGNNCYNNTFGNNCYNNTFGNDCYNNTFGNDCAYLKISDNTGTRKVYIGVDSGIQGASSANKFDLYDSAILDKSYQVTFKKSAGGKYLMLWATDTGTMTGKVKDNNTDTTWEDIV